MIDKKQKIKLDSIDLNSIRSGFGDSQNFVHSVMQETDNKFLEVDRSSNIKFSSQLTKRP